MEVRLPPPLHFPADEKQDEAYMRRVIATLSPHVERQLRAGRGVPEDPGERAAMFFVRMRILAAERGIRLESPKATPEEYRLWLLNLRLEWRRRLAEWLQVELPADENASLPIQPQHPLFLYAETTAKLLEQLYQSGGQEEDAQVQRLRLERLTQRIVSYEMVCVVLQALTRRIGKVVVAALATGGVAYFSPKLLGLITALFVIRALYTEPAAFGSLHLDLQALYLQLQHAALTRRVSAPPTWRALILDILTSICDIPQYVGSLIGRGIKVLAHYTCSWCRSPV